MSFTMYNAIRSKLGRMVIGEVWNIAGVKISRMKLPGSFEIITKNGERLLSMTITKPASIIAKSIVEANNE